MKKRILSWLLALLMVLELLPLGVLAEGADADFAAELAASVSPEDYPDGLFDFLTARMETSEDIPYVEFAVVRRGNTEKEASVTFKAVDVSARYGEDYYIEVEDGLFDAKIARNEDAPLLIEGMPEDAADAETLPEAGTPVLTDAAETAEAYALPTGEVTSLRDAVLLATGRDMNAYDWQDDDEATLLAFEEASAEMYDELPGHETVLTFRPGENEKLLRFYTVDDPVSEDDEQVMFVLSHPENCAVSENPTGYMNIVDNEDAEPVTFAFSEELVTVAPEADEITVELRRLTGNARYTVTYVGTAEGTAEADVDYASAYEEVIFSPGQTAKQLTFRILSHPVDEARWFTLHTADGGAAMTVVLEPQLDSDAGQQSKALLLAAAAKKTTIDLRDVRTQLGANTRQEGEWFYANHSSIAFRGVDSAQLDLTMVQKLGIRSGQNSKGTKYTKKSGCSSKTCYHDDMYNQLTVNGLSLYKKYGQYEESVTLSLTEGMQTANAQLAFVSKGESGCTTTNGYLNTKLDLYYEPFFVDTNAWDSDATISPMIYTGNGAAVHQKINVGGTEKDYTFHAGTIRLTTGDTRGYFYDGDTIEVEPVYDGSLTAAELDGIYLWGVKFQRLQSGSESTYFYLNQTSFSLRKLYNGEYTDYYTGQSINANCLLREGDTRGYKILPVFRQKTAYSIPELAEGIRFAKSTFEDDGGAFLGKNVIVTGRLDQIELDTAGVEDLVVRGWDVATSRGDTAARTHTWYLDEVLHKVDEKAYDARRDAAATELRLLREAVGGTGTKEYTLVPYNYGAEVPGHLYYTPTALFNYISISVMKPTISVTVNPRPGSLTAQGFGAVGYEDGQIAQYSGVENGLARGSEITISPYSIEAYDLLFVQTEEPGEGMKLKVRWQDFTGDTNKDGIISEAEYQALGKQVQALYGSNRVAYVGNTFSYVPKVIGSAQVYYEIVSLMDDPAQEQQLLFGVVQLRGGDVIAHSAGAVGAPVKLGGVKVSVDGMETVTDENGRWELSSSTFRSGEIYSVNFTYDGRIYTDAVGVNTYHTTNIDEYDAFDVQDFRVREGSTTLAAGTVSAEAKDKKMRFSFRVVPAASGIDPSKVEVELLHKDGTSAKVYEAYPTQNREWVIRTADSLSGWQSGSSDYSFNPMSEGVAPGDYFEITVYDQFGNRYFTHKAGFRFTSKLSYVSVLNSFLPPQAGVVFDFFDSIEAKFDFGLVALLDQGAEAGMKAAGIKTLDSTVNGVKTKTIAWGWNTNYTKNYKPKEDKPGEQTPLEAAKDDVRQAASDLDGMDRLPTLEEIMSADPDEEPQTDAEKLKKAEETADAAIDTGKDGKQSRSNFAAGVKLSVNLAVSLEMGYDEAADRWYFVEFLVVGKVGANASATYSYMTPIGIKLGIKATLSGDVTAMLGFLPYYSNPGAPDYRYIGDDGSIDLLGHAVSGSTGNADINREMSVYGKLIVRPTVSLTVSAALLSESLASVSLTGSAAFDMVFTSGNTGSGGVKLSAKLKMSLLGGLIKKEWKLAEQSYNMFSYANGGLLMGGRDVRYDTITSDDMATDLHSVSIATGGVSAGFRTDRMLIRGVNFDPSPIVESLCDSMWDTLKTGAPQALLVYLDRKPESSSTLILYYSVLQNSKWSAPQPVDPDSNGDDSHSLTWMGDDRIILSWSTYVGDPDSTDPQERLNARKLRTAIFDIPTATFGPVQELTKQTDADTSGDVDARIVWFEDENGDEQMMALYRKSEYAPSGDVLLVGDTLNPASVYAFRTYDFTAGDWNDHYYPDYLSELCGGDAAQMEAFEQQFYGQYFMDFGRYADVKTDIFLSAAEMETLPNDSRGLGVWAQEPTAADVELCDLADRSRIVSMTALDYHDYGRDFGIFAYVVDYDGAESTTDDRDILLKVYNFTERLEYPAFRLTKNSMAQNHPVLSVSNGGTRLFYSTGGSIADLRLNDIFDSLVRGEKESGSGTVPYLLENRMPEALTTEEIVVAKKITTDESGETVEQTYDDFSLDWNDLYEVLTYTEPGVSYENGLKATDAEAALPENQRIERQLYVKTRLYESVPGEVEGEPVETWSGEWWPYIQITDLPGMNILRQDSACNSAGEIVCASLRTGSIVDRSGDTPTAAPDMENCWLSVGTYDRTFTAKEKYGVAITAENAEALTAAEDGFELILNLRNEYYLSDSSLHAEVFREDGGEWRSLGRTELPEGIPAYAECRTAVALSGLPEERDGMKLRVEVVGDSDRTGVLLGEAEFDCAQSSDLRITDVLRTLTDRNHAVYTVSVENAAAAPLTGGTVSVTVDGNTVESEAFDLAPGRGAVVTLEVEFPESAFTEERADGMITETAAAHICAGTDSVEDILLRSAPEAYESLLEGVTFVSASGQNLANSVYLSCGGYLLPYPTADGLETDGLRYSVMSSDSRVAAVDGVGGVRAMSPGVAELRYEITPNTAGYLAQSEYGDITAYSDALLLPSALVKSATLTVMVPTPYYPPVEPEEPEQPEEPETPVPAFEDVPEDSYFAETVEWAVQNGITLGVSETEFAPFKLCTRAEVVTFLWRMAGSPEPTKLASFTDVEAGSYYEKAVAWALETGVTLGVSETEFAPDLVCTRAQAVTFLGRYAQADMSGRADFTDVPETRYYAGAVAWAAESGVTNGTSAETFSPDLLCERCQIVTFLFRFAGAEETGE